LVAHRLIEFVKARIVKYNTFIQDKEGCGCPSTIVQLLKFRLHVAEVLQGAVHIIK